MKPVSKPYLPSKEKYISLIDTIYENNILTNNGPLVRELESRLCCYLGVKNVICVANGSLALQVAYKALGVTGEVITTPFSFAATSSTLLWEGIKPVYCDIDRNNFNININNIEKLITRDTTAILPVHVFGNPCNVEEIDAIKNKYSLKVIYDAAHAFGVQYNGHSVLNYGDISTLSFHATKIFHTIEGGAIITNCDIYAKKIRSMINFGLDCPSAQGIGTNAKMNEFEAAMGICVLDDMERIIFKERFILANFYKKELYGMVKFQKWHEKSIETHAYMPIVFNDENSLINVQESLLKQGYYARRYFYPSLDKIYMDSKKACELSVSNDISQRILCLPLYAGLELSDVEKIVGIIKGILNS
ncbi:UDP-4-amino-4-deoxy-L-arabinose--oxoglutarate aminotransferase [Vibrio cholerae]|nr:dTDP-4-amino-4,6-dideoxy-D-glucose transaminase [Vibrio cholerae]GHZ93411.1 UDP-4-amino-4-deoxy-L-arabinose--oxoglutarate aminotransferase [Vibrio cholerae]